MPVRARFCPSPTGPFHVGGARTALFNWLFARGNDGKFLLRNEDTDPVRSEERWLEGILEGMRWLGLDWDEDIVHQSRRRDAHLAASHRLLDSGHAYWCDCTPEAIAARRPADAQPGGYDGFCRDRGLGPADDRVVRFRVPDDGTTTVVDIVRDEATFENATIDDFVIVRRGASPMFVLANVVDDDFQQVTHVIRGEEHLSTTPKYLLLRHALGMGDDPVFAHLSLLVNEKRQKLSKRRDKVQLLQYREEGYLAEAMRNYLALLGWSPRDGEEITTVEKMIDQFRLEDVSRAPAFFDEQKLQHFNAHYIRELSPEAFAAAARPFVEPKVERFDAELFAEVAPLAQTRVKLLSEVPDLLGFLFTDDPPMEPASWDKAIVSNDWSRDLLSEAASEYASFPRWSADPLKDLTASLGERRGLKLGKTQAPIRVAVTGNTVGPPLFESLEALGRDVTVERLRRALERIGA
ncbi:MAG TPA: glutamate--tRNA ligase [Solirubrobacteraceae bacterium]